MDNDSREYILQLEWKLNQLKIDILKTKAEIDERNTVLVSKQEHVENLLKLLEVEGVQIDRTSLDGIIPVSLAEIVLKVLKDNGQPMSYKDIAATVAATGHKVPGQNPPATIVALLHRKKEMFTRRGSGIWGLVEWGIDTPKKASKGKRKRRSRKKA